MIVVTIAPPAPVVSLNEAKRHLRVDHDDDDTLISALVDAAQQHIDGPGGWLGRAIGIQTLEMRTDRLPGWYGRVYGNLRASDFGLWQNPGFLSLPYRPIRSIVSIKYLDTAGATQTISSAGYVLNDEGVYPAPGYNWPTIGLWPNAVMVRYQAGYDADAVPAPIKQAILLLVGHFYENRETEVVGARAAAVELPTGANALLSPYRLWG